ncbi:unnamed protein product [Caenorhabditis auriculariae]|uniref:ERAP1-like C-terminal domain-containing protein n=1 Tax=Caenorhabditis auriculariae TaxID=2777116 RepID=A0A8S1HH95_9PELO|nr:unnamed protein product [Caenorhabditis auriculariae]
MLPDIASKRMPVLDRFGLINDLFALVNAGRVSISQFVSVAAASLHEDEYVVWGAIDEGLSRFSNVALHINDETKQRVNKLYVKLFAEAGAKLGFVEEAGEDSQKMMLRSQQSNKFTEMFNDHVEKQTPLHPDIRLAVFGNAARNGGKEAFDRLLKIRETTTFGEIDRQCIVAMSQTPDEALLTQLFDYGIGQNKVRPQDQLYLFLGTGATRMAQDFAWKYFKQNIKSFMSKYGGANSSLFQRCLKFSGENFSTEAQAKEFQDYFCSCEELTDVDRQTLTRPIGQTVESIRLGARLLEANREAIENLLKQHNL